MANGTLAASQIEMLSQSGTGITTITPPATNTNRSITLPDAAGQVVLNSATQTLTNKTIDYASNTLTGVVGLDATQTLTNKTLTSPTLTTPNIDSAPFATVSGTAPIYPCRAWVNFDGTTSPGTIRASGNVSSVTRNGTGDFTVNFTTALPDANYCVAATTTGRGGSSTPSVCTSIGFGSVSTNVAPSTYSTTAVRLVTQSSSGTLINAAQNSVAIFR